MQANDLVDVHTWPSMHMCLHVCCFVCVQKKHSLSPYSFLIVQFPGICGFGARTIKANLDSTTRTMSVPATSHCTRTSHRTTSMSHKRLQVSVVCGFCAVWRNYVIVFPLYVQIVSTLCVCLCNFVRAGVRVCI